MGRPTSIPISTEIFAEPARELTDKQAAFVKEYVGNGGNGQAAAIAAGYSKQSANSIAVQLKRNPLIQQAVQKELVTQMGYAAVPALARIVQLVDGARSDYVRLEAAKDLLNRSGFQAPTRVDHRLDAGLSVTLSLGKATQTGGGVEMKEVSEVTPPDVGKSSQKLLPQFPMDGPEDSN
jgi:hypothetical protein